MQCVIACEFPCEGSGGSGVGAAHLGISGVKRVRQGIAQHVVD